MVSKIAIMLTICTMLAAHVPEGHRYIACGTRPCARSSGKHPHPRLSLGRSPEEITATSTNWSGYVVGLNLAKPVNYSVTDVSGSWVVPTLQPSEVDTSCSIWVGIDGSGSSTVEQIGTEHDVTSGQVSHYAWYEMFPAGSNEIVGFPVAQGDTISASVTYIPLVAVLIGNGELYILQIVNNTQKLYTSIPFITTQRMQRVCAEWVVEAPYLNGILPLSNFGIAYLMNCMCTINGVFGSINNPVWQNEAMNMVSPSGASKAVTSALSVDGKSFSVQWEHN